MVKFIKYRDEELPISVSFYALEKLEDEGLSLEDEKSYKSLKRLFWHSLLAGHFHEKKELKLKEDDLSFILDECFDQFNTLLPLFLAKMTGQNGQQKRQKKPVTKS